MLVSLVTTILILMATPALKAQRYGVQSQIIITQPTVYLPDYYSPGSMALQVSLRLLDLNEPAYNIRLVLKIEGLGNGIILETLPVAAIAPIRLTPFVTTLLAGSDLAPWFEPANLSIRGIGRDAYNRHRTLPAGNYTFTITAYDANRPDHVQVSNASFTMRRLQLATPPEPIVPANKGVVNTGFFSFMWTAPMGLGMLTSPPDYQLEIYELLDPARPAEAEVAASSPLIVRTVNMLTSYPFNILMESPQLVNGRTYAWRVRATFPDGRAVVDRNGYSRVNTFVYNTGVGALGRPAGLKAKAESQRVIAASWEAVAGSEVPDGYRLEYRKTGNSSYEWFAEETTDTRAVVRRLEPSTEYELRVQPMAGGFRGDYSNIVTVRTPDPVVYDCDTPENTDTVITNHEPLMSLMVGDYFTNSPGFEFHVVEVTRAAGGIFEGFCTVNILWLGGTYICKFAELRLNTDYQMLDGYVDVLEDDLDEWVASEALNPTDLISALADEAVAGYGTGHVVTGDAATAITTTTTGMPDVVVTDESITVNGTEVAVTSTTGGCSITDAGGTLYVVDESGRNVTEVGKMPEETVGLAEYRATAATWNNLDASNKVHFANDDNLWAFDQYNEKYKDAAVFATAYEDLDGYRVPWKLVPAGKWGKVTATLTGSVPKPDSVVFRTPKGTVYHARRSGKNYSLTIVSGREHDVQEVYALYPAADSGYISLGKLCVATYPMQARRLTIVPVSGANAPGADNTADKLNDIYRPYGIEWTVNVEDNWNNTSWDITTADGLVEADGVALFSSYTDEMKALIAAYRSSGVTIAPESPYIFVVPGFRNSNSTLLGDMPLSLQFGFVAEGANRDMVHTIAHELGHGVYQLWHTFSSRYSLEQESTPNLMDYTDNATTLIKKQWDLVHDPASIMLAWAIDEEEGEMVTPGIYYWSIIEGKWVLSKNVSMTFKDETLNPLGYFTNIKIDEINKKRAQSSLAIADAQKKLQQEINAYEYAKSQNIFYLIYQISPFSSASQATINFSNGEYGWGTFNAALALIGVAELNSLVRTTSKSITTSLDDIWKQTDFNRNVILKNSLAKNLYKTAGEIAEAKMGLLPVVDVIESGTGVAFRAVDDFVVYENGLKKTIDDLAKAKQVGSVAGISGEVKLSGVRLDIAIPSGKGTALPENISSYAKTNGITVKIFEVAEEAGEIVARTLVTSSSYLDNLQRYQLLFKEGKVSELFTELKKTTAFPKMGNTRARNQADLLSEYKTRYGQDAINFPYSTNNPVTDFELAETGYFVRVYSGNSTNSSWIFRIEDLRQYGSVDEIVEKLALPSKPAKIGLVELPEGVKLRKSYAGPQTWSNGTKPQGGGVQYEIIGDRKNEWFKPLFDNIDDFFK